LARDAGLPTAVSYKTPSALGLSHPKHPAFEHRNPTSAQTLTKVEMTHNMLLQVTPAAASSIRDVVRSSHPPSAPDLLLNIPHEAPICIWVLNTCGGATVPASVDFHYFAVDFHYFAVDFHYFAVDFHYFAARAS
jgi:hypothetical protein